MPKSVGKQFEADFAASVPKRAYFQRLKDPAQSFGGGGENTRFSLQNPYDCFMYAYPNLFVLELKTAAGAMSFWRKDFENDVLKHTYNIKRNQIKALQEASKFRGVIAGFVLNFRNENLTYFLEIDKFLELTDTIDKKSINQTDVASTGIVIPQRQLRVNWKYDIKHMIDILSGSLPK